MNNSRAPQINTRLLIVPICSWSRLCDKWRGPHALTGVCVQPRPGRCRRAHGRKPGEQRADFLPATNPFQKVLLEATDNKFLAKGPGGWAGETWAPWGSLQGSLKAGDWLTGGRSYWSLSH